MGLSAGAFGLADLLGGAAAAAPEVAAAAAPEVAGAIALPEIAVTAAAPEIAAGGAAAAGGLSAADVAGVLGAGALGIGPALAGGLSPSSVVGGEFAQLPGGGAGPATPIGAVPGFGPGGAPLPTARPAGLGGGGPGSPGAGGGGGIGWDTSSPALGYADPSTTADATNPLAAEPSGGRALYSDGKFQGIEGVAPAASPAGTGGGISGWIANNPGTAAMLGLGGLSAGAQLLNKSQGVPYLGQQQQLVGQEAGLANQQTRYGQQLEKPLLTGQLPPGQQAVVAKGLQDAISTIKGRYAAMGLTGSTMEADAIANAQQQSVIAATEIEAQMAQTGQSAISSATQALQLESGVYNTIMNAVLSQDQNLANAVSQFASSAALGTAIGNARGA